MTLALPPTAPEAETCAIDSRNAHVHSAPIPVDPPLVTLSSRNEIDYE